MQWLKDLWNKLFGKAATPAVTAQRAKPILDYSKMPLVKYGETSTAAKIAQTRLKELGWFKGEPLGNFFQISADAAKAFQKARGIPQTGDIDSATWKELEKDNPVASKPVESLPADGGEHAENPAYKKAKTFAGKTEYDSTFSKYLDKFWAAAGLKSYVGRGIAGASLAWCMLFIVAMQTEVGQKTVASAMAEDSCRIGVAVDFVRDGIPQGAFIRVNHNGDCSLGSSGNHTTMADGDCTPEEIAKKGAMVPGFGGNQGDKVGRSMYCVNGACTSKPKTPKEKVCCVRWPSEVEKPGRITKSKNCAGTSNGAESTR